jgi:hypothetical protein
MIHRSPSLLQMVSRSLLRPSSKKAARRHSYRGDDERSVALLPRRPPRPRRCARRGGSGGGRHDGRPSGGACARAPAAPAPGVQPAAPDRADGRGRLLAVRPGGVPPLRARRPRDARLQDRAPQRGLLPRARRGRRGVRRRRALRRLLGPRAASRRQRHLRLGRQHWLATGVHQI